MAGSPGEGGYDSNIVAAEHDMAGSARRVSDECTGDGGVRYLSQLEEDAATHTLETTPSSLKPHPTTLYNM